MNPAKPTVSIIVPAYNEETALGDVLTELTREFGDSRFEIIVVDDGSEDRTAEIAAGFPVRLIRHKRNRGYGASLKTGIRAARGSTVAFIDADAQHRAENLRLILHELEEHDHEMVLGVRTGLQSTLWRTPGKFLIRKIAEHLVKERVPDINSGMRVLRRSQALRFLPLCPDGFSITSTLTLASMSERLSIGYVPIQIEKRRGTSTVRWKDGLRTLFNITALMVLFRPIRVFLPLALAMGLIGAGFGVYGIAIGDRLPNTSVILCIGAVIVFCFGFIAEQIALLRRVLVDFRAAELKTEEISPKGETSTETPAVRSSTAERRREPIAP